ncbi:phytanoyl-CoA dioxygenase family protein [Chitinophaga sp. sic0106]|uniref:phytanoyl-CoA dioxygenase family protein n=1 Tax=Chitinophaga sp. sic0106 TaxID=2854785 RepID=UPI001C43B5E0|nr:phytanoyl-CoA dioxygenase family protein [Chitinophaga sp. sic0106]MBV7531095.1 phytanoyl-CoA dioxygenase family protein [Chitinophaga sp. sic0106]
MEEVLHPQQIQEFITTGFVRIDHAFDPATAAAARDILWRDMGLSPDDPTAWQQPVIRLGMYSQRPFIESANTPRLLAAFDQLVGVNRWLPCGAMGTFPVRFPSADDPGDTGWHVDASFGDNPANFFDWRVNWRSKNRALLMLFLYSDISDEDAPTRIKTGSHLDIAQLLYPAGEAGMTFGEIAAALPSLPSRPEIVATGNAGTVYLCHPFLVHAAQSHHGSLPRFLAQPPLLLKAELMKPGMEAHYSPVEQAIQLGIRKSA